MASETGRRVPTVLRWPVVTAVAYAVALAVVYYLSVRTVRGRLVTDASLRGAISAGEPVQDTVEAVLDVVSIGSLLGAVAVVAFIALLRLDRIRGLAGVAVLGVANAATWVLKELVLSRPDLGLDEVAPATLNSLPSGHTTAAFSAVAALLVVLPAALRVPTALLGGGYAAVTAMATMFAGWHRAADAMAAFLVVGISAMAAVSLVVLLGTPRPGTPSRPRWRWWAAATVGALVLGGTLSLVLSAFGAFRDTALGSFLAFTSEALLVVGTLLGVLVSMLRVLEVADAEAGGATLPG